MLQILLRPNNRYSVAECAQMAIEADAQWLILDIPAADAVRDEINAIVELCRDAGVMLTCTDVELAKEYKMHGVFLTDPAADAVALRDELGPEAVVATVIDDAELAPTLENSDIDYVAVAIEHSKLTPDAIRATGYGIGIVAYAPALPADFERFEELRRQGYNGICAGPAVFEYADDPIAFISHIIERL